MEKIKLIAIDIGGTLITDSNEITDTNLKILNSVRKKGIKVALITARMYSSTKYISHLIGASYGVFGNGASIIDLENMTSLYTDFINVSILRDLIKFGKKERLYVHLNQLFYETSDERKYFAEKHLTLNKNYPLDLKSNIYIVDNLLQNINHFNDVIKIIFVSEKNMDNILEKIKLLFPHIFITEYNKNLYEKAINKTINYIEVSTTNSNKADGLCRLINFLNISPDEVLVIGDGDNDIEMFRKFSNSGCLANGTEKAKKNAKYVSINTNNDSGVAEIIKKYINE